MNTWIARDNIVDCILAWAHNTYVMYIMCTYVRVYNYYVYILCLNLFN